MAEIHRHGMPTTDMILSGMTDIFWNNRRTVKVLKPLVRHQVLRLAILACVRPKRYEVIHLTMRTCLFRPRITPFLIPSRQVRLFEAWKAKGEEDLTPSTELSWFQVRHAEGLIVRETDNAAARSLFEKNLGIDPVTGSDSGLYNAIVGVQWNNLQAWMGCVLVDSRLNPERPSAMNDFLKAVGTGKMVDFVVGLAQEHDPRHAAFKESMTEVPYKRSFGFETILQDCKETVANFGSLAKLILHSPSGNVWKGLSNMDSDKPLEVSDLMKMISDP